MYALINKQIKTTGIDMEKTIIKSKKDKERSHKSSGIKKTETAKNTKNQKRLTIAKKNCAIKFLILIIINYL